MRGPFRVDEDLTRDVTLTKFGSPYYFGRVTRIAPEATLRIHPGVEMYFEENAGLEISGCIIAAGLPAEPVVFTGDRGWKGLFLKSESSNPRVKIRNGSFSRANCALTLGKGNAEFQDVELMDNTTGINIAGSGDLLLRRSDIRKNQCGINVARGKVEIEDCNFSGNKIGIKVFPERIILGKGKRQNFSFSYNTR
jgi:hypothetical protein